MLTYNETKARFPLSLDGRGARGEGALRESRSIAALLLGAWLFAPQAALADPLGLCGAQTTDGLPGTADTITCDPNESYPDGITYTSDGDLTLEVLPNDPVDLGVAEVGIDVSNGDAADNLFWDSSDFTAGDITGTDVVLDYLSDTGNVEILVGGGILGTDDATHAIRAESTGGGSVSVTTLGDIHGAFGSGASGTGIEALTTSGDIAITTQGRVNSGRDGGEYAIHADSSAGGNIAITTGSDFVLGRNFASHGVLAETTGTGNITINAGGLISVTGSSPNAFAGIEAVTDSGNINVAADGDIRGPNGVIAETGGSGIITLDLDSAQGDARNDASASAIRALADSGDITIDANFVGMIGGGTAIVTQTDGVAAVDIVGTGGIEGRVGTSTFGAAVAMRSTGGSVLLNLSHSSTDPVAITDAVGISAPLDFSGLAGNAEFNVGHGGAWILTTPTAHFALDSSVFSPGDDVVNIAAGGYLSTPITGTQSGGHLSNVAGSADLDRYIVDFGDGADVVNNNGGLYVGLGGVSISSYESEIRLENLAEFRNAGVIWLGSGQREATDEFGLTTDFWPDDIFAVPNATFVGQGGLVLMDADFNSIGQAACDAGLRNADGDLPANDCIDIRGADGAVTGVTLVHIEQMIPGDRGAYNPDGNVVVDLAGSDPANTDPDAFLISPTSQQYSPSLGGIIDKGLFFYTLAYDPADQQFKLYGLPAAGAQQLALLGQATNQLWRTSAGAWFDRTVDQRDIDRDDRGGSMWFRGMRNSSERDEINPILGGGEVFEFDNSYSQDDTTATLGVDFIARPAGDSAWTVGGMLGYARAKVDFDDHPNTANIEGMHAGLYGNLVFGWLFVDAAVNHTWLDLHYDVPALNLVPSGTILDTDVESLGGQVEAGWRWRAGRLTVEPLAGLSYVKSDFKDVSVPAEDPSRFGAEIEFDDPTSTRGSLGVRLRMDNVTPGVVPISIGLTAKAIEEFDGESQANIVNVGPIDAPVADTLDGTFGQVTGDVSVTNAAKTVAGFLKVDSMFHDDYESLGISIGFRAQW